MTASALYADVAALQKAIEAAGVQGVELAASATSIIVAGTVQTQRDHDIAIALAEKTGKKIVDSLTIAEVRDRADAGDPEIAKLLADARRRGETSQAFELYRKAIALADERQPEARRIELRLELEAKLRGPLKYAEAAAVCAEALAKAEALYGKEDARVARVAYAFAYCLHEGSVFHKEDPKRVEKLYERAIALTDDAKLRERAEQMLEAWREAEARRKTRKQ